MNSRHVCQLALVAFFCGCQAKRSSWVDPLSPGTTARQYESALVPPVGVSKSDVEQVYGKSAFEVGEKKGQGPATVTCYRANNGLGWEVIYQGTKVSKAEFSHRRSVFNSIGRFAFMSELEQRQVLSNFYEQVYPLPWSPSTKG